jgi:triacylglycerol lipase
MTGLANKLSLAFVCVVAMLASNVQAQRDVVFVHGLAGFGKDELGPINYWGIFADIIDDKSIFPDDRYTTHEASIGPVSSNWDRACELYAQVVGGRVDYGLAHSTKYGHERFGKTYAKGFVPNWNAENKLAFVGHSMGATTIHLLEILLNEGAQEEIDASGADVSPLFKGGNRGWISSVTGISAPYDGTTLVPALGGNILNLIKTLVAAFAGVTSDSFLDMIYDFDLDHFGLAKKDGESHREYKNRVYNSKLFQAGFEDYAGYDLSVEGAARLNSRGRQAYPETTYFSVVTSRTFRGIWPFNKIWYPKPLMFVAFQPFAVILGAYNGHGRNWEDWRQSDGLVPARSQTCPKEGAKETVHNCLNSMPRSGRPQPGKYYQVSVNMDHGQVIGFLSFANGVYRDIARQITSLEVGASRSSVDFVSEIDPEYIGQLEESWGVPESTDSFPLVAVVGASVAGVFVIAVGAVVVRRRKRNTKSTSVIVTSAQVPEAVVTTDAKASSLSYLDL